MSSGSNVLGINCQPILWDRKSEIKSLGIKSPGIKCPSPFQVDLYCDDEKQAQVKLLEIEKLLKKEQGQQKIRTKLR